MLKVGSVVQPTAWANKGLGLVLEHENEHQFNTYQFLGQAGWGFKTVQVPACRVLFLGDKIKEKVWIEDSKLEKIC